jgi:hypothetical protein
MRSAFLVISLCLSLTETFAQKVYVGLEGGLCFTNAKIDDRDPNDKEYRNRMSIGMNYEFIFNNRFLIGTGLSYAQKGFKEYPLWIEYPYGIPVVGDTYTEFSYDYLAIPVKFGYSMGKKFILTPKIGIYGSYLVKAQSVLPTIGYGTYDILDQVSKFDFGGLVELEGTYPIGKLMIFSSVSYSHGLIPITTEEFYRPFHAVLHYGSDIKHEVISLSLGMKLMLK